MERRRRAPKERDRRGTSNHRHSRAFGSARSARPILLKLQKNHLIERSMHLSKAPTGCRELIRRSKSLPLPEELKTLLHQAKKLRLFPESKLGKALTYAFKQWDKIVQSFYDGRLEVDTNRLENKIHGMKLGLKDYLFLGSAEAGGDAAVFYTLIENCQVQGLDPERYIEKVIELMRDLAVRANPAALTPAARSAARNLAIEVKTA